jgi:protein-S-isoprenylcysteine O-methyltransferase Ste14
MKSKDLIIDYGERIFLIVLAAPFLVSFAKYLPTHPQAFLLLASECIAIFFILIRKSGAIDARPYPLFVAFVGTALGLLIRPGGTQLAPELVASAVMATGVIINISAKLALNRSFGLVAANRGIKVGGPYRIVRHPMYLGYFVTQVGFLLMSFSVYNLAIYAAAWTVQVLRIIEEERLLSLDPKYRALKERVRWRVLPGF